MMSYEEERMFKATVTMRYAKSGFVESAKDVAKTILEATEAEDIKSLLDYILLEYTVVDFAKRDLDFVMEQYGGKEGDVNGEN